MKNILKNPANPLILLIMVLAIFACEEKDKPSAGNTFTDARDGKIYKTEFYFTEECWFNLQTKEIVNKKDFHVFVELPKFGKLPNECHSFRDKIIWLFKNLHTIEERPENFGEKLFDRIFDMLEISKLNREDLMAYLESIEGIDEVQSVIECAVEEASDEWFNEGKMEGKQEDAHRMLEKGLDPAFVADITGFPINQIMAMR